MKKALFLDRDGIVNIDKKYVYKKEEFEFMEHIFEFCKFFIDKGFLIFIITNQAGIGRGYYSEKDFLILTEWMQDQFKKKDIIINSVYYCPHHAEFGLGKYKRSCECRKPEPGMILNIADKYNIDLKNSILVGDKTSDIEAGIAAEVSNNFLIKSKYQTNYDFKNIKELLKYLKEK